MSQNYAHNEPPEPQPTGVDVAIDIYDITEINQELQTLTLMVDIIVSWTDPEISVSSESLLG